MVVSREGNYMNRVKGKVARVVYDKLRNGDHIYNDELVEAQAYYTALASVLHPLGDVFRLAASEAQTVADRLYDYVVARGLNV